MKSATRLAVCSIVSALSVVLLFLGGITFVLAYIMPMIVGLFMIMLRRTFGTSSALITYTAVSILSFILVADKECMLMYVLFFGFYPIIQPEINKIKSNFFAWIFKFIVFNIMVLIVQLILVYVFGIPFLDEGEGKAFILLFVVLMNIMFVIYDKLIDKISLLYQLKLEKKIKKFFK